MEIRISRILSDYYDFSRKEAEELIRQKRVKINGRLAGTGDKAEVEDTVLLDEVKVPLKGIFRRLRREAIAAESGDFDNNVMDEEQLSPKSRSLRKGPKNGKEKDRSAKKKGKLSQAPQASYKQSKHRNRRFDFSDEDFA